MSTPAAIFQALAKGHDLKEVRERFQLTPEQLQELFQEVADHFRDLEEGVWSLYCDGASRGNPGQAGAGVVLIDALGDIRVQHGEYLGQATNNVAEYQALILGLKMARNLGVKKLQAFADSELLVRQLKGVYRVKAPHLQPLYEAAQQALKEFETFEISHVPRNLNHLADRLANAAIDQKMRTR
ncbi:MAG: ribonuclease HI family protein [Thermodesulfobacteriota bacterium]